MNTGSSPETWSLQQTQQLFLSPLSLFTAGNGEKMRKWYTGLAEFGYFGSPLEGRGLGVFALLSETWIHIGNLKPHSKQTLG